jgi:hypothetical protein
MFMLKEKMAAGGKAPAANEIPVPGEDASPMELATYRAKVLYRTQVGDEKMWAINRKLLRNLFYFSGSVYAIVAFGEKAFAL